MCVTYNFLQIISANKNELTCINNILLIVDTWFTQIVYYFRYCSKVTKGASNFVTFGSRVNKELPLITYFTLTKKIVFITPSDK